MKKIDHYNILLVDDEYFPRQSIKHSIEEIDDAFVVTAQATNGQEALDILSHESIHIVITDISMPVMNGLELAKRIRQLYPDIATVILTGYAEFEYIQEALRQGTIDYLLKPVSEDDLISVFSRIQLALDKLYILPDDSGISTYDAESYVNQSVAFIQKNYMNDIDMGSLASDMGFSSAYLTKLFKKYAGKTPVKLLTEIRIHHAKKLLLETDQSIQEVGINVGYPDQFHFSKTFRKIVGMNPSAFRSSNGIKE